MGGDVGLLRSLNLQRPLLPNHPSWRCHVPFLRPPTPSGPTYLPSSLGYFLNTKFPRLPQTLRPQTPTICLSVCPQGPSSRGTIGDITEATVQTEFRPVGVGWAICRVDLASPL